ncbi:MAG: flagellar biosynthesis protein FliQ [Clostridiaceae bacterium]|nr:flagellar biosynthesis protein FliQ [Clostridiaceae bacterium]
MSQGDILRIMQSAIFLIIEVSAPVLLAGLVVGLLVSVFQAMTQINEQTLVFVPKILAILLAIVMLGGWMMTRLSEFTTGLFGMVSEIVK